MNSDELLLTQCARRLTGKNVQVRLRHPTAEYALGQTYKTTDGAVVDVEPNMDDDTVLKVFLHEAAHVKNDLSWMPVTTDHLAPSGSIKKSTAARDAWRASAPETAADILAGRWLDYAERHYREYDRPGYTRFGQKLLSLIDMKGV